MKKFIIAVIAVFVAIGAFITATVVGKSRVSLYLRDSDDHLRDVVVNGTRVYAVHTDDADAPRTSLDQANTSYFLEAVTRSGLLYKTFSPSDQKGIVVTFADGGEYTVIDGGRESDGKDVAYILYRYKNYKYCFSLSGYETYQRVSDCVRPEGFGSPNWVVDENGNVIENE